MSRLMGLIGRRNPTYLIGIPGILMLVAGLALGAWVTIRILNIHAVPVGTTVASVTLCMAGAMCVLGSIVLRTVGRLRQEIAGRTLGPIDSSVPSVASPGNKGANRALSLFGLLGLAALFVGLLWGAWAVYLTFTLGGLHTGSYIGSASCCLAGLMMILVGMTLHALRDVLREVQGAS
jgi:hypothetical protein